MKYTVPFLCSALILTCASLHAQNLAQIDQMQTKPLVYAANKISNPITIDGKANEAVWTNAPWTSSFIDIEGTQKTTPKYQTRTKMLWDEENLYIYAELEEPHVWGDLTKHDAIIYHNNDFEVFIKPFESQAFYYEIEVNALNTIMDLMMPKAYRFGGDALMHWDLKGLKSAIHTEGTLNNAKDKDQHWAVEMAIPFRSLGTYSGQKTPQKDSYWRINFSRVQWQHEVQQEKYHRKKDGNKFLPEDNWVWSPIGVINMHHPERWGYLKFVENQTNEATLPDSYQIEQAAWNIFYLQQEYKRTHNKFAASLEELPNYEKILAPILKNMRYTFLLNKAASFYKLTLQDQSTDVNVSLDSHGNYHINNE